MKQVKQKKCKRCKSSFTPFQTTQTACSVKCALYLAKSSREEKQKKHDKIKLESMKTASDYIKEAQIAVNRYVRARDKNKPCISCGCDTRDSKVTGGGVDAGHYRSRGAASHLRFNVLNIWSQCKRCNRYLGGNYSEYRKELIERVGALTVEALENNNEPKKFTIEYLKRVKVIFNKRARFYEKRLNLY